MKNPVILSLTMKSTIMKKKSLDWAPKVDFTNTEIAFKGKTDSELKKASWLFSLMNKSWLVDPMSNLGLLAMKLHIPLTKTIIKKTMFEQFVGGTNLLKSQKSIDRLWENKVQSILDYGAEAKETEKDFNLTMNENIRAIEFAATNESAPIISTKITGLARFKLLEDVQNDVVLKKKEKEEFRNVLKRVDSICHVASKNGVGVFIDAEESWIQDTIDHITDVMMKRYNKERVVVYNTFQMYRKDRLQFLMDSFEKAKKEDYLLGAKLVRGAYMEKERVRAGEMGYVSPIQVNKKATDDAYNVALRFCIENYESIGSCAATHNAESCQLQAKLIHEKGIQKDHPHLSFCQLFGMSDHLTFNLADAGYNVSKYLVYGQVDEVFPYLVRRAKENTSVSGDMSREYSLIMKEMNRRELT